MVNIMDEYTSYTKKCLNNYMKLILGNKYNKTISDAFASVYINVRYSNYLDEQTSKLAVNKKIDCAMDYTCRDLKQEFPDLEKEAELCKEFYKKIYNIDQLYLLESQKNTISEISKLRKKLLNIEEDDFENIINNELRDAIRKRKEFLDGFNSDMFELKFDKIDKSKKYVYAKPHNNIKFPDLYSKIAIEKAQEKDTIQEDLAMISYLQLCSKIVYDLISCDFDTLYFIDLPKTFFDKKTKLARVVNTIDNPFIQEKIRVVVTFQCFTRYKSYVLELKRQGFVFAIYLDKSFDYSSDNIEYLEVFDKIIMENNKYYNKDMLNNGKINTRIISVDEVK